MQKRDKPATRNLAAAANPLLRKGGAHRKSRKTARQQARQDLRRDTRRGFDLPASPHVLMSFRACISAVPVA